MGSEVLLELLDFHDPEATDLAMESGMQNWVLILYVPDWV
jgi:hypothetical protein